MTSKTSAEVRKQPRDTSSRDRAGATKTLPHLRKARLGSGERFAFWFAAVVAAALSVTPLRLAGAAGVTAPNPRA